MTINTDYAQYWAWGHRDEPVEPPKKPDEKPQDVKPLDIHKNQVTSPKWLKKGRSRAKL